MSYRVLLILWVPLGENWKEEKAKKTKKQKTTKNMERNENERKKKNTHLKKKHLKKGPKGVPPSLLQNSSKNCFFDTRPLEFGIVFLTISKRVTRLRHRRQPSNVLFPWSVDAYLSKCDQHCEVRDSVNDLKVERILFLWIILESMSWMVVFFSFRLFCSRTLVCLDVSVFLFMFLSFRASFCDLFSYFLSSFLVFVIFCFVICFFMLEMFVTFWLDGACVRTFHGFWWWVWLSVCGYVCVGLLGVLFVWLWVSVFVFVSVGAFGTVHVVCLFRFLHCFSCVCFFFFVICVSDFYFRSFFSWFFLMRFFFHFFCDVFFRAIATKFRFQIETNLHLQLKWPNVP